MDILLIGLSLLIILLFSICILMIDKKTKELTLDIEKTTEKIKIVNEEIKSLLSENKKLDVEIDRMKEDLTRVNLETSILEGKLSMKVDASQIIEQINLSAEDNRIDGEKVMISANTLIEEGVLND